jgi:L-lactate dehydrogenase complex protein LldG
MYGRVARSPRLFSVAQKLAALGSILFAPFSQWMRLPAITGWGYSKDFPRFAGKTFRERFSNRATENAKPFEQQQEHAPRHLMPGQVLEVPVHQSDMNLVAQFTRELTTVGGQVHDSQNATEEIIQILISRGVNKIHLEPNTLNEPRLQEAGILFTSEPDPEILVGVTKALCGLADTGSVLEADGQGSPLHASLLPEIHIAVLSKSDILPSLPDAMPLVKETRAAAFITGPSRTADIEMTLTIGVHGPKEIIVFLTQ